MPRPLHQLQRYVPCNVLCDTSWRIWLWTRELWGKRPLKFHAQYFIIICHLTTCRLTESLSLHVQCEVVVFDCFLVGLANGYFSRVQDRWSNCAFGEEQGIRVSLLPKFKCRESFDTGICTKQKVEIKSKLEEHAFWEPVIFAPRIIVRIFTLFVPDLYSASVAERASHRNDIQTLRSISC